MACKKNVYTHLVISDCCKSMKELSLINYLAYSK